MLVIRYLIVKLLLHYYFRFITKECLDKSVFKISLEAEIQLQEEEVARAEWLLLEEAMARFTFADDQNVVAQLIKSAFMQEKLLQ